MSSLRTSVMPLALAASLLPVVSGTASAAAIEVQYTAVGVTVSRSEQERSGGPFETRQFETGRSDTVDQFRAIDVNNSAFQSLTGLDAVRAGGVFFDGLPGHQALASASFEQTATVLPLGVVRVPTDVFLDYLLFPGTIGLDSLAPVGSFARVQLRIASFSNDDIGPPADQRPRGVNASARFEAAPLGSRVVSIDEALRPTQALPGTREIDGFDLQTVEIPGGFDTAYLGTFLPGSQFTFTYQIDAEMRVSGFENAAIARIGDPFALRGDALAELFRAFPDADTNAPPFRLRAVPQVASDVPEPMGLGVLSLAGLIAARRLRAS